MPLISLLLHIPLDGSEQDAKELHNLGSGSAKIHGSQNSLS
jgi:hypothetical protein